MIDRDLPNRPDIEVNSHPSHGYWELNALLKQRGTLPRDWVVNPVVENGQEAHGADQSSQDLNQSTRSRLLGRGGRVFKNLFDRS